MKKLLMLTALVVAGAFASTVSAADALTVNDSFPIDIVVFVPCANGGAGEDVHLTGTIHDLFHVTIDSSGLHLKTHDNPQGVSGVGLVTGAKYQGTGVTQEQFNFTSTISDTFVDNFRIVGQGSGNNFIVHENTHLTVNANGDVTATVDNFSADCK